MRPMRSHMCVRPDPEPKLIYGLEYAEIYNLSQLNQLDWHNLDFIRSRAYTVH
jgi:hypothetical protein